MKKIILCALLFLFVLNMGVVFASDNYTDDLNQTTGEKSFTDIQISIDNAKNGETIDLNGNYTGLEQISISKSVTIVGHNNTVLDAKNNSRIFNVQKGEVTFKNLNLINGNASNGGAVYSKGNCIFINCTFKQNHAGIGDIYSIKKGYGGAIYSQGNLTVKNSVFDNNHAEWGGAVAFFTYLYKDSSKSNPANVNIQNTLFKNNIATDFGGALYFNGGAQVNVKKSSLNSFGKINIKNTVYINNSANCGGSITCFLDFGSLILRNNNFINNSADYGGAAIDASSKIPVRIYDSNFLQNMANYATVRLWDSDLTIENSNFTGNVGEKISCIVGESGSKVSIIDSNFKKNSKGSIVNIDSSLKITDGKSTKAYSKNILLDDSYNSIKNIIVSAKDFTSSYFSGDVFNFKLTNKYTNKPIKDYSVYVVLDNGKKIIKFSRKINNGIGKINYNYDLKAGKYKVTFVSSGWGFVSKKTITLHVKKAKTIIKAPKVINKYKKSKYFKITVKNKLTKNLVSFTKVKVKIFTGKKYKTYVVGTNEDGVAKLNTKTLKKGYHKVVISSGNKNYIMSKKSSIRIK